MENSALETFAYTKAILVIPWPAADNSNRNNPHLSVSSSGGLRDPGHYSRGGPGGLLRPRLVSQVNILG